MKKFSINDNTVSAYNQLNKSSERFYLGEKEKDNLKVLVLGNSITCHGVKPSIGWENNWGMAASSIDKDYVHLLFKDLKKEYNAYVMITQIADWEKDYNEIDIVETYKTEKEFNADIIIFNIGENVSKLSWENYKTFKTTLENFILYLKNKDSKVILATCFWKNALVDKAIRILAKKYGTLVELNDLGARDDTHATGLFWHGGVSAHPGDKGMALIGERIISGVKIALNDSIK